MGRVTATHTASEAPMTKIFCRGVFLTTDHAMGSEHVTNTISCMGALFSGGEPQMRRCPAVAGQIFMWQEPSPRLVCPLIQSIC